MWVRASTGLAALAPSKVGKARPLLGRVEEREQKAKDPVHEMEATVKNRWKMVRAIIIEEIQHAERQVSGSAS